MGAAAGGPVMEPQPVPAAFRAAPEGVRLVWRVADMQVPAWPGLAVRECSRCGQPVYLDTTQAVPPGLSGAVLVCVPCGLADKDMRPWIVSVHREVRAAALWADGGGPLP